MKDKIKKLQDFIYKTFDVNRFDMIVNNKSKKVKFVIPRMFVMYFLNEYSNMNDADIAYVYEKDKKRFYHAINTVNDLINSDVRMKIKAWDISIKAKEIFN